MMQTMGIFAPFEDLESDQVHVLTQMILAEREKRLGLVKEIMFERQKNKQLEEFIQKLDCFGSKNFQENQDIESEENRPTIGMYPASIRKIKIMRYKRKIKKYRQKVKISRTFKGRSVAAKLKPRYNGKFAKKNFYQENEITNI